MSRHHVYRMADGVRVEGTSRHIFIRNGGTYYLTDLLIFADGVIDCWGPTDLDGLLDKLTSGWVATSFEEGGQASAHHVGRWKFAEVESSVDPDMLLGEVADELDRLNDRPDSTGRCRQAIDAFLADRTEANRAVLRERYLAIPEHLRVYALGDMDHKDWPLRVLATPIGERTPERYDGIVTAEMHETAIQYFEDREADAIQYEQSVPADGPETPQAATVSVPYGVDLRGGAENPGIDSLQIDWPAAIDVNGRRYPSVEHAYWALSTPDESTRAAIAAAGSAAEARGLAETAPRCQDWPAVRQAVMMRLLWSKFTQHPKLGEILLSTRDGQILCPSLFSAYWGSHGANWAGRLLELVRSELALARSGPRFDGF